MSNTPRPFGLRFLEVPADELEQVAGGAKRRQKRCPGSSAHPYAPTYDPSIATEAMTAPRGGVGRPDSF
jgi:hypothetical protein